MSRQDQFDFLFKIVMIGDSGVGKTNLLSRFVDNTFTTDSKPTIGVEFATKTLYLENKSVKSQIWDTAGQQRFRAITNAYYRGAMGAIIVFDLTKSKTFQSVQKWLGQLKQNAQPDITIMLMGNKSDLQERQVNIEKIQSYVNEKKLLYLETSAQSGYNVDQGFSMLIKQIFEKMKNTPDITPVHRPLNPPVSPTKKPQQQPVQQPKPDQSEKKKQQVIKLNQKNKQEKKKSGCC